MNILDLPKDPLAEIWIYLSSADVVRFGMICKRAQSISWAAVRELDVHQSDLLEYVLSRDLSNIIALEISITYRDSKYKKEPKKFLATLAKIPKLAEASNLRQLSLEISVNDELPEMELVSDTVVQLTNLDTLWIAYNHPKSKHDLGNAFKNHHKLTSIGVATDKYWCGINQLTQLKSLYISEFDFKRIDQNLVEIAAMTQLTQLILGDLARVSKEKIGVLSNLRNLKQLNMMDPRSINFLLDLPNLSNLSLTFGYPGDIEEEISLIGRLTTLTHLLMDTWNSAYLDVDQWTNLTNLKVLSLGGQINEADFTKLKNITQLVVLPRRSSFQLSNLPANLIHLGLSTSTFSTEDVELISSYPSLRSLEASAFNTDELHPMSKLTNLESIWADQLNKEQIEVLRNALPSLKFLCVMQLESDTVPELLQFTQLCSLGYRKLKGKDARVELHSKAPFAIIT